MDQDQTLEVACVVNGGGGLEIYSYPRAEWASGTEEIIQKSVDAYAASNPTLKNFVVIVAYDGEPLNKFLYWPKHKRVSWVEGDQNDH